MTPASVLLLADSRLPGGGHVHSGGVEMAVAAGLLRTEEDVDAFLRGRLHTTGVVLSAFSAAACLLAERGETSWHRWDAAFAARTPVPSLRIASTAQGTALCRTVLRMWDTAPLRGLRALGRPHHPLVLGAAVAAGGGTAGDAATLAAHHLTGGACSAAVRLLGLDPIGVAAVQSGLATLTEQIAELGLAAAKEAGDPDGLPGLAGPLPELLAAQHSTTEVTLFAS
jgi:urease accessory protein